MALGGEGIAVTALADLFASWGLGVWGGGKTWRALRRRREGTRTRWWLRLRGRPEASRGGRVAYWRALWGLGFGGRLLPSPAANAVRLCVTVCVLRGIVAMGWQSQIGLCLGSASSWRPRGEPHALSFWAFQMAMTYTYSLQELSRSFLPLIVGNKGLFCLPLSAWARFG